jgi:hypothetical protein
MGLETRNRGRQPAFIDVGENYLHPFVRAADREFATKSAGCACDDSYFFTKLLHASIDDMAALWSGFRGRRLCIDLIVQLLLGQFANRCSVARNLHLSEIISSFPGRLFEAIFNSLSDDSRAPGNYCHIWTSLNDETTHHRLCAFGGPSNRR